jgi:hypothetical protein
MDRVGTHVTRRCRQRCTDRLEASAFFIFGTRVSKLIPLCDRVVPTDGTAAPYYVPGQWSSPIWTRGEAAC